MRSLIWDDGPEMRDRKQVRVDAEIEIFFCDPHAQSQRDSNENTNGLLRQYYPKRFDFSTVTRAGIDAQIKLRRVGSVEDAERERFLGTPGRLDPGRDRSRRARGVLGSTGSFRARS